MADNLGQICWCRIVTKRAFIETVWTEKLSARRSTPQCHWNFGRIEMGWCALVTATCNGKGKDWCRERGLAGKTTAATAWRDRGKQELPWFISAKVHSPRGPTPSPLYWNPNLGKMTGLKSGKVWKKAQLTRCTCRELRSSTRIETHPKYSFWSPIHSISQTGWGEQILSWCDPHQARPVPQDAVPGDSLPKHSSPPASPALREQQFTASPH